MISPVGARIENRRRGKCLVVVLRWPMWGFVSGGDFVYSHWQHRTAQEPPIRDYFPLFGNDLRTVNQTARELAAFDGPFYQRPYPNPERGQPVTWPTRMEHSDMHSQHDATDSSLLRVD
jgi:hypothetical protein